MQNKSPVSSEAGLFSYQGVNQTDQDVSLKIDSQGRPFPDSPYGVKKSPPWCNESCLCRIKYFQDFKGGNDPPQRNRH